MTEPTLLVFNNLLIIRFKWLLNTCTRNNCISCDICEVAVGDYSDDEIHIESKKIILY